MGGLTSLPALSRTSGNFARNFISSFSLFVSFEKSAFSSRAFQSVSTPLSSAFLRIEAHLAWAYWRYGGAVSLEVEDIFPAEGDYLVRAVLDEVVADCPPNANSLGYLIFLLIAQVRVLLLDKLPCPLDGLVEDFIDGEATHVPFLPENEPSGLTTCS